MIQAFIARVSLAILGSFVAISASAQQPVSVPGSEQFLLKSAGNGVEYRIDVALPSGYATSTKRYPVFYILDANLAFTTLVDSYRGFRINSAIPELIIVGIGYPETDPAVYTPNYAASRSRDYTPTSDESAITGTGHAREFLAFVSGELIPMVDGRYRTDPADRALGGHSLGGLFTTYALLNQPGIFKRYWIGSPSLWWDKEVPFTWLTPATQASVKPTGRVYLSVGADESEIMVPPMVRMAARLTATFPSLEVSSRVFPGEDHMSVVGGSISRALRFLYRRARVPIKPADLPGYVGRWTSASGDSLRIVVRASHLTLTMPLYGKSLSMELLAENRDRLFSESLPLDLVIERDAKGRVVKLRRSFLGADLDFERAR